MADTWGIGGTTFLLAYTGAFVVLLVLVVVMRERMTSGAAPSRALYPYEVALLSGGRRRAIAASLIMLRAAGSISAAKGRLHRVGKPGQEAGPLDKAVLAGIAGGCKASQLEKRPKVRRQLDMIKGRLESDGFVTGPGERARARLLTLLVLGPFLMLGIARLVAGVRNDRPVGFLTVLLVVVGVIALILICTGPTTTRTGDKALKQVRRDARYLDPKKSPAWTTYGFEGMALSVALYGSAALLSIDPAFAAEAHLERELGQAASGSSGGDGGSGCGGGGDGGGGGGGCGG